MKGIKVQVSGRLNGAEHRVNGNEMVTYFKN
jgi:ribosomal protein S3